MTPIDLAAMQRAVELAREESIARRKRINADLAAPGARWIDVAEACCFHLQCSALNLMPWESPPMYANSPESHALMRRMTALNISRFEADPVSAIIKAEQLQAAK